MIKRTLKQIQDMASGTGLSEGYYNHWIKGVSTDSRSIKRDQLFIPLIGEHFDGHQYVEEAIRRGAAASLWQQDHPDAPAGLPLIYVNDTLTALQQLAAVYRKQLNVRVIGITGSNGKTTTKDMAAAALATTYKTYSTMGNLNNHIGVPLTLLQMDEDTEMAVIEMGMSGRGEIELLSRMAVPECAIITNIGESHLLQLGSRDEIARAKLEIVSGLKEAGLLIYFGDEPLLQQYLVEADQPGEMLTYRYGSSPHNDIYPSSMMFHEDGCLFQTNAVSGMFEIPLLGQHNVTNALSVIALSKYMGVSDEDIMKGLKQLKVTGMRIEKVICKSGLTVLNDAYNASPTSMKAAIQLLEDLKGYDRKYVVLGDMLELGHEEIRFHHDIGEIMNPEQIHIVFTYGRLAEHIALGAKIHFSHDRVKFYQDKETLLEELVQVLKPNDVVLVKGSRGMKLEQIVDGLKDK